MKNMRRERGRGNGDRRGKDDERKGREWVKERKGRKERGKEGKEGRKNDRKTGKERERKLGRVELGCRKEDKKSRWEKGEMA